MATQKKTFTSALAIFEDRNGNKIGKVKNFNINEQIQRVDIQGAGDLTVDEVPPVKITCSASFDFHNASFKDSPIDGAIDRKTGDLKAFVENFLLQDGTTVKLFRRVRDAYDSTLKQWKAKPEIFAVIDDLFIDGDNMDVPTPGASSRRMSFRYLEPVLFDKEAIN